MSGQGYALLAKVRPPALCQRMLDDRAPGGSTAGPPAHLGAAVRQPLQAQPIVNFSGAGIIHCINCVAAREVAAPARIGVGRRAGQQPRRLRLQLWSKVLAHARSQQVELQVRRPPADGLQQLCGVLVGREVGVGWGRCGIGGEQLGR